MNELFFYLSFSFFGHRILRNQNKWQLMLFKKPNCSLCYFMELEFRRTEKIFKSSQTGYFDTYDTGQNTSSKLSFQIIDCSRHERKCSSYGSYGVPLIILTDNSKKHIFRYNGEKSALCERLTSFITENTNIHPKKKYYLEKYDEIIYDNKTAIKDKIEKLLYHANELDIVNFSYVHQLNSVINIEKFVSTGRCVALALPIQGVIPIHSRMIFDHFYKENNFYPIVLTNKNSYRIEENIRPEIGIILFTSRGEFPIFVNDSISNIINTIHYFCFVDGSKRRRQFIEMLIFNETEKTISLIEKSLNLKSSSNQASSNSFQDSSTQNLQVKPDSSTNQIITDSQSIYSTESAFQDSSIPVSSSSQNSASNQENFKLPYEFRYFAENPIKLISFAKMMYEGSNLEHVIYTIEQLRKTIINGKIGRKAEEMLSQRIMVLKVIRQIFLENLFNENEVNY